MIDPRLTEAVEALTLLLRPYLERSAEARRAARALGAWLLEAGAEQAPTAPEEPPAEVPAPAVVTPPGRVNGAAALGAPIAAAPAAVSDPLARRAIVPLKIGDVTVQVPVAGTTTEIGRARQTAQPEEPRDSDGAKRTAPIDLALIERRSQLKAESCRVYLERRAPGLEPERAHELTMRMNELIREGRSLTGCFLWVFWKERTPPPDAMVELIGAGYEALAECAGLLREVEAASDGAERVRECMALLAWASSALLSGMRQTWLKDADVDQDEAHHWVRVESARRQVYLSRHMRIDDPAEIGEAAQVLNRVRALREQIAAERGSRARSDQSFKTIRYHTKRAGDGADGLSDHDRQKVTESIERLLAAGVAPSDPRFAEALPAPLAAALLEKAGGAGGAGGTGGAGGAVGAVFRVVAERASRPAPAPDVDVGRDWSPRALAVRELLRGRVVVVVGGERRADAVERMMDAFELSGVEWVQLSEHGPGGAMRAPIQRPETALVLALIRLAGHLHVDEAREYAAAAGKPCVSIPRGYNPEQIAEEVLAQVSHQLSQGGGAQ